MPDNLSDIVQITITKETTAIDTASFNIPLILADTTAFSERTRTYSSISAVAEDFGSSSDVYTIASRLFGGGSSRPTYIVVGRRQAESVEYSVSYVEAGQNYAITINGERYSYEAVADDTDVEISAGLAAAYADSPVEGVNVTAEGGIVSVQTSDQDINLVTSVETGFTEQSVESTETWPDAIAAIETENDVWYGVVATTHVPADVLAIATAIQARSKVFGTSTQDPQALTVTRNDIGGQLSELNYDRTFWVYSPFADEDYPEAAWMGSQLPMTPGSNTWAYKQATGVRPANLSDTQKTNIRNKNGNTVTRRAGVVIFEDGRMASGTWIDEVIGIDWWVARVQESIFFRLINSRKVPMTRAGASIIETEIRSVNALGVANGLIADDTPATVTAPDPLRIPANMRAQRTLGDFRVRFRLAGAVHKVLVDAVVGI